MDRVWNSSDLKYLNTSFLLHGISGLNIMSSEELQVTGYFLWMSGQGPDPNPMALTLILSWP